MKQIHNFIVEKSEENLRLDTFLSQKLPEMTRSKIAGIIKENFVKINQKTAQKAGEKLKQGDEIKFCIPEPQNLDAKAENLPLEIVYEDNDLAVINKPQGMVVHAGSGNHDKTLVNALLYHIKDLSGINGVLRPGIVHRLDKNTAGLLVVAKNDFSHVHLAEQIAKKTCHREYVALLEGSPKQNKGTIETHIARSKKDRKIMAVCPKSEGKIATTNFEVLETFQNYSLAKFILQTGRTHQIRVHCKEILHCPIANDSEYGGHTPKILHKSDPKSLGQYLVARRLEFIHPKTGRKMSFEIEVPEYFSALIKRLKV